MAELDSEPVPASRPDDALETFIYVIGGRDRGKTLGVCERYCVQRCEWERCPLLNEQRGSHGAATLGGLVYAVGGGGLRSNLASVEVFDGVSNAWRQISPMSVPRHALSAVVVGSHLFAVGGWMNGNCSSNDVERYNHESDTWAFCAPLQTPRKLFGLTELDGLIYAFGGADSDESLIKVAECYSPVADKWYPIADLPVEAYATAAACGGSIYVFLWGKYVARYDVSADRYHRLGALPLPEWFGFCASVVGDDVYVLGGQTKGQRRGIAYRYAPATDTWHPLPPMRMVRRRCASAVCQHPAAPTRPAPAEAVHGASSAAPAVAAAAAAADAAVQG